MRPRFARHGSSSLTRLWYLHSGARFAVLVSPPFLPRCDVVDFARVSAVAAAGHRAHRRGHPREVALLLIRQPLRSVKVHRPFLRVHCGEFEFFADALLEEFRTGHGGGVGKPEADIVAVARHDPAVCGQRHEHDGSRYSGRDTGITAVHEPQEVCQHLRCGGFRRVDAAQKLVFEIGEVAFVGGDGHRAAPVARFREAQLLPRGFLFLADQSFRFTTHRLIPPAHPQQLEPQLPLLAGIFDFLELFLDERQLVDTHLPRAHHLHGEPLLRGPCGGSEVGIADELPFVDMARSNAGGKSGLAVEIGEDV